MAEPARVAYIFPGQGSQHVGMGLDLYNSFESAKAVFKAADETLGFPLSRLCFEGPEEELRQTINAQPALVAVSIACLKALSEMNYVNPQRPAFAAGHSLGEYTALAAVGVLDFNTTVYLARERGRLMWEAGLAKPGGMVAILGLDENALSEVCRESGTWLANINCPGQLVISGAKEDLGRAIELAKVKGALRAIPLPVSGGFHTPLMQSAVDGMTQVIAGLKFKDPTVPIVANTTAQPLTVAQLIKEELLRQLCNGIQWQRSVEYMISQGVTTFLEIGPGKVLSGLIKRINREVKTLNIGSVGALKEIAEKGPAGA